MLFFRGVSGCLIFVKGLIVGDRPYSIRGRPIFNSLPMILWKAGFLEQRPPKFHPFHIPKSYQVQNLNPFPNSQKQILPPFQATQRKAFPPLRDTANLVAWQTGKELIIRCYTLVWGCLGCPCHLVRIIPWSIFVPKT